MDSSDEDETNNPLSSLTEALASATANERDKRQRKVLVERLVRRLFDTLEGRKDETKAGAVVDPTSSDGAKAASEDDAAASESSSNQRTLLVEQILAEGESGSTTIANTFSSSSNSEAFRIVWNQDRPLTVHWVWQATKSAESGVTEQSSCNLSVVAKEGVAIEFYATNNADKIALCEVSKFQWTLEGSTETTMAGLPNNNVTLQNFWKIERATFSWSMGEVDDELKAEEILLEGTDISFIGKVVMLEKDDDTTSTNTPLQLAPDAVLSLQASSVGSLGGNDQEKRRVGQALRALDSFLDTLLSKIPNLHLSIVDINNIDRTKTTDDTKIPPFGDGEANKKSSLGDVLKYYLKHYCSSSGSTPGTTVLNHSNNDNENVASAAKARLSSLGNSVANFGSKVAKGGATVAMRTTLGSAVSLAADGVAAAARKGKDIRLSQSSQGQPPPTTPSGRVSLDFEGQSAANTDSEIEDPSKDNANNDEGYKFGDVARGVFGSIREKRQQAGEGSQNGDPNKKNEYVKENKGKIAGVAGGSAGAVAGLIVAGPLGAMAGSFLGSQSGSFFGSRGSKNQEGEEQKQQDETKDGQADADAAPTATNQSGNSRFGDRFRTFAARGKEAVGGAMAKGKEVTGRGMTEAKGLLASVRGGSDGKSPEAPVEAPVEPASEEPVEALSEVATDLATAPVAPSDLQTE